jgi:N utilization substance protein B
MNPADRQQNASADAFRRGRRYARECVLRLLYQLDVLNAWDAHADALTLFWDQIGELDDPPLDCRPDEIRRFAEEALHGVVARRAEIDRRLADAAEHWRLDRMSIVDRNILRLAAYEILFCPGVPPVASLDEAIELAKAFGDKDSWRFVNGILDRLLRERTG